MENNTTRWIILDSYDETEYVKVQISYKKRKHYRYIGAPDTEFKFPRKDDVHGLIQEILTMIGHGDTERENGTELRYIDLTRENQCEKCYVILPRNEIKREIEHNYKEFGTVIKIDGPLCGGCAINLIQQKKDEIRDKELIKLQEMKRNEEALDKLRYPLLKDIDNMDGFSFQKAFSLWLLETGSFDEVIDLAESMKTGDFGADVIGTKGNDKTVFQCKKLQTGVVGVRSVQEVYAAKTFYDCANAFVVTNQFFSLSARKLADKLNVELWDRNRIKELINAQKIKT